VGEGTILTSTDGDKWVRRTNSESLSAIAHGKGLFVAVGPGLDVFPILTSPDGINWFSGIKIKTGYKGLGGAQAIAYGAGYFVAVGEAGILTSADGLNWVQRPTGSHLLRGIAYGNGHFVGVGFTGIIVQSGSIINLEIRPNTATGLLSLSLEGPAGLDYAIQTSTDLVSWRDVTKISHAQSSKVILDGLPVTSDRQFYRAISQ
jgi:hypothetical protein